jgi:mono/diheme cytochrome c family protein
MRRLLKFLGVSIGALVALLVVAVAGLYAWTSRELRVTVASPAHGFAAAAGPASVARGEHVLRSLAKCNDCHAADLGGEVLVDDPAFARLIAPNLTTGRGGVIAGYSDAELEAAIRHGVARDGRRLMIMPSDEYQHLSDEDLGALIAYLRSVPATDRALAPSRIGPVARALYAAGKLPLFPHEAVTHGSEAVAAVAADTTVAYGQYLGAVGCAGCHGAGFGGGKIPGAPPEFPPVANLTPTGIGHYSFADFDKALKEGLRPDGTKLHPMMPIHATKLMTPLEVTAVWNYLRSLPPREYGTR